VYQKKERTTCTTSQFWSGCTVADGVMMSRLLSHTRFQWQLPTVLAGSPLHRSEKRSPCVWCSLVNGCQKRAAKINENSCGQPAARSSHTKIRLKTASWAHTIFYYLFAHLRTFFSFSFAPSHSPNTHIYIFTHTQHLSFPHTLTSFINKHFFLSSISHAYPQRIHRHHSYFSGHLWFPARLSF
jgi:hypothetical protein